MEDRSSQDFIIIMNNICSFCRRQVSFDTCMVPLRCVGDAEMARDPSLQWIWESRHCLMTVIKFTLSSELSAEEIVFDLRNKKTKQLNNHFVFMSSDRCMSISTHTFTCLEGPRSNAQSHWDQKVTGTLMLSINRSEVTVNNNYLGKDKAGPRPSVYELL